MSIATKCKCGHSISGVCLDRIKECTQLIRPLTVPVAEKSAEDIEAYRNSIEPTVSDNYPLPYKEGFSDGWNAGFDAAAAYASQPSALTLQQAGEVWEACVRWQTDEPGAPSKEQYLAKMFGQNKIEKL